jgi:hypothetical protein
MSNGCHVPVTIPDNAIALLRKAAADKDVAARMEKTAKFLGELIGGGAKALGRGLGGTVARSFTSRLPGAGVMGGRRFSAAKTLGTAAAAAPVYQHASNAAEDTHGMSANPLTWFRGSIGRNLGFSGGPSREDIFKRNQQRLNDVGSGIKGEMDQATMSGDRPKWNELNARYQSGDFAQSHGWDLANGKIGDINPLSYRMGGLNPWAKGTGADYQNPMAQQQGAMQGDYNEAMKKSGPQPGDQAMMQQLRERLQDPKLLPHQHAAMQQQLDSLQRQMTAPAGSESALAKQIRESMTGAGMRHVGYKPAPNPAPGGDPAAPLAYMGRRPQGVQGNAVNRYDFRRLDPWEESIRNQNSPFQFSG